MDVGRRVLRRVRPGLLVRQDLTRLLSGCALAAACLVVIPAAGEPSIDRTPSPRLVLSSNGPGTRALAQSSSSLYQKNDPWRAFLASDRICPGGERTDLPVARQASIAACLVNYARQRRGLNGLALRSLLDTASLKKATAIVRCGRFAHSPCGGDWTSAVRSVGYPGDFGENLYLASGRWAAPRVAVHAWLNSPAHRRNLFRKQWRDQGITLLPGQTFGGYTDISVWVSVLGDP